MVIYCMDTQSHVPRLKMSRLPIIQLLSVWRLRSGDSSFESYALTTQQDTKARRKIGEHLLYITQTHHSHTHYASFLSQIHTHGTSKVYIYIYIHIAKTILPSNTVRILL